ncbi:uncharacterized protein LOC110694317 [Chenopodium quinoa]|uniref:uncharacterized protein LOC110694317 n=1 Tax=Chenopodium quinoa TaxID=63459 RepID=UPI000B771586|nr:uncharacterized protein LOC110694317 [Chenopodium quinoa]
MYQRLVDHVFAEQKGRNMEVYVDDSIVKSKEAKDHVADLAETFATLRKHQMKLNPKKCVFGVKSGKFLGFMVSKRGIDVNPAKVHLKGLGKRFSLLQGTQTSKSKELIWEEEQKIAFQQLREHLAHLPSLARPAEGETLYLYVAVSLANISMVLLREEEKIQQPIYFVSHTLTDSETRYPFLEKVAYAVVVAAQKLRPYFDSHQIVVLTDQPLEKVIGKVEKSDRLTKWALELTEFSISYQPRAAIKAQALADFLAECSYQETVDEEKKILIVFTDGSATVSASNNEAEYEAAIAGLELCIALEAEHVCLKTDSQLVANQIRGKYEAKEPSMVSYLAKIKAVAAKLRTFEIELISKGQNAQADALSKLASSSLTKLNRSVYVKRVEDEKSKWIEELPGTLWSLRTIEKEATGHSPIELVYGSEVVLPVEIGSESLRVNQFSAEENEHLMKESLDFLDEIRDSARDKMAAYKQRISKFYNRRVQARLLKIGDLVLRNAAAVQKHGKLSAN